ncbi:MAG: hypothetical protein ACRD3W_23245, partial [Terriglobales bacterium]
MIVICILALAGVVEPKALGAIRALTFTCNIPNADCGGYLGGHTWSLSVEEQFYLIAPMLLVGVAGHLKTRTAALAAILILTILWFAPNHPAFASFAASFLPITIGVARAANEPGIRNLVRRQPTYIIYPLLLLLLVLARLQFTRIG